MADSVVNGKKINQKEQKSWTFGFIGFMSETVKNIKEIRCVTRVAQDGIHLERLSRDSGCDVPLLLSLIATFGRIWAALSLISGANHF